MTTDAVTTRSERPKKDALVQFRATLADEQAWTKHAERRGLSLSAFLRIAANAEMQRAGELTMVDVQRIAELGKRQRVDAVEVTSEYTTTTRIVYDE